MNSSGWRKGDCEDDKVQKTRARILANPNPNFGGIIENGANGKIRLKSLTSIHKIFNNNLFFLRKQCVRDLWSVLNNRVKVRIKP